MIAISISFHTFRNNNLFSRSNIILFFLNKIALMRNNIAHTYPLSLLKFLVSLYLIKIWILKSKTKLIFFFLCAYLKKKGGHPWRNKQSGLNNSHSKGSRSSSMEKRVKKVKKLGKNREKQGKIPLSNWVVQVFHITDRNYHLYKH